MKSSCLIALPLIHVSISGLTMIRSFVNMQDIEEVICSIEIGWMD